MATTEKAARDLLTYIEACYTPTHHYVPANLADFRHLDLKFYETTKAQFENAGFTHLCDEEDETLRQVRGNMLRRVMIRTMVSPGGDVMAGIYHPRAKFWPAVLFFFLRVKLTKAIDCETEYTDGSFLVTSHASLATAIEEPPMVHSEFMPPSTATAELIARHSLRMKIYSELNADASPRIVRTREDLLGSQNRLNALKSAFRKQLGGVSLEELERLSGKHREWASALHSRIQQVHSERTGA